MGILILIFGIAHGGGEDIKPEDAGLHNWATPDDKLDYPNLDIGHYQVLEGVGNCHKCLSLSRKSMYANFNPDCRAVAFEGAPLGSKNLVPMAQGGRCYEDDIRDYAHFLDLHEIKCIGFASNFFECEEHCPFDADSNDAQIQENKIYTVFGDSKCQYRIKSE